MLTSQFSGSGEAFQTTFPQASRKRDFKSQAAQDEGLFGTSLNSVNKIQDKGSHVINTKTKQPPLSGVCQHCIIMYLFVI
jgi:hypothetical protein